MAKSTRRKRANAAEAQRPAPARHSGKLARKLLGPMAAAAFLLLALFTAIAYRQRLLAARAEARQVAEAVVRQVSADRRYYTQHVVTAAHRTHLEVTNHYQDREKPAIPLPTTFVREVSEVLSASATGTDYKLAILSLFPINPRQGPRSAAERALMKLNYTRRAAAAASQELGKESFYTLYQPDVANAETCVTCHNSLPESPKRNYELGDVMGTLAITIPMTRRLEAVRAGTVQEAAAFAAILVVAGGLIVWQTQRTVLRPTKRLAAAAADLASGNLAVRVNVDSNDEVGRLAESFGAMLSTVRQVVDREVAGRQTLDHTVGHYVRFLEGVTGGSLVERLEIRAGDDANGEQLARLGELLNRTVDLMGSLAAHVKVFGERLGGEPSAEELRLLAQRMRDLASRYQL
jgi:HAMP domain-containing protein